MVLNLPGQGVDSREVSPIMMPNRPIRIAYFVPECRVSQDRVFFSQVLGQADALEGNGFECLLVGAEKDAASVEQALAMPQVRCLSQAMVLPTYPEKAGVVTLWKSVKAALDMAEPVMREWVPDVIYTHRIWSFLRVRKLARQLGSRLIYDARGLVGAETAMRRGRWTLSSRFVRFVETRVMRQADGVLCVSNRFKKWIAENVGRDDAYVVPCCAGPAEFGFRQEARTRIRAELGWSEDAPVVVYCGGLSVWQRVADVVALMAKMKATEPGLKCLLLAHDPKRMAEVAKEAGLVGDDVRCMRVASSDVPDWLSAADAGIILRHDVLVNQVASPVKITEYLACGLAVVCSEGIGDQSEMVDRAGAGVVVRDDDPAAVSKAVALLRQVKADPETMRERAQKLVAERFSWPAYLAVYREAYAPRQPS